MQREAVANILPLFVFSYHELWYILYNSAQIMTFWESASFKATVVIHPRSSESLIIWAAADRLRPIKLCSSEPATYRFLTAPIPRNKELVFARVTDSTQYSLQSFTVLFTGHVRRASVCTQSQVSDVKDKRREIPQLEVNRSHLQAHFRKIS